MFWNELISTARLGKSENYVAPLEGRTEFQRDYDRLIFSAAFRRMQNKTQVFPLPGSIFVHNRLTHSLEVSSVGRSLGHDVGISLTKRHGPALANEMQSLESITSAACLAHDMGNPPFGHSGENAIRTFFSENEGSTLRPHFTEQQWMDITKFDGNANTFRLLTHQFEGRRPGGFVMTYSTLASVVKYPFSSTLAPKSKFGFFESEQPLFEEMARKLGLLCKQRTEQGAVVYARHPLVYLVEAADDICYEVMDVEDAHKLRLLSFDETEDLLLAFFDEPERSSIRSAYAEETDLNDRIVYYRACVINHLVRACVQIFVENEEPILAGQFEGSLVSHLPAPLGPAFARISKLAKTKIYNCKEVTDVEIAGYHIIYTLLELMVDAVLHPEKAYSKLLLCQASKQYALQAPAIADRIMAVLDYLSGMTDVFALDLYRKINGHSLPVV